MSNNINTIRVCIICTSCELRSIRLYTNIFPRRFWIVCRLYEIKLLSVNNARCIDDTYWFKFVYQHFVCMVINYYYSIMWFFSLHSLFYDLHILTKSVVLKPHAVRGRRRCRCSGKKQKINKSLVAQTISLASRHFVITK